MIDFLKWHRYGAPASWLEQRKSEACGLTYQGGDSQLNMLYKSMQEFWEPQDKLHYCAKAVKALKGMLNEHDFNDRLRSHADRSCDAVMTLVNQQNQRRVEYTRMRLLLAQLYREFAPIYESTVKLMREHRSGLNLDTAAQASCKPDVQQRHLALAKFGEICKNGELFDKLEEYRQLACEDATNGQGLKAMEHACMNLDFAFKGDINLATEIPIELQIITQLDRSNPVTQMHSYTADGLMQVMRYMTVNFEPIKVRYGHELEIYYWAKDDREALRSRWQEMQSLESSLYNLVGIVRHIITHSRSEPGFLASASCLHMRSGMLGAHYVAKCAAVVRKRIEATMAEEFNAPDLEEVCEKTRKQFDKVADRCPTVMAPLPDWSAV